jgi:hypothetical protein
VAWILDAVGCSFSCREGSAGPPLKNVMEHDLKDFPKTKKTKETKETKIKTKRKNEMANLQGLGEKDEHNARDSRNSSFIKHKSTHHSNLDQGEPNCTIPSPR